MLVSDFDFDLPVDLIAQDARPRGASRLLVVDRRRGSLDEGSIDRIASYLDPGDLLVANDTRVFPARLLGRRLPGGGAAECLLLHEIAPAEWHALVHPGQRLKPGSRIVFEDEGRAPGVRITGEVLERLHFGRRRVRFDVEGATSLAAAVDALGHVPLPPYIDRQDTADDRERYQTVYARRRGSVAAPTAGLHFNDELLQSIHRAGICWATITLHVGYGTFKPVRAQHVEDHRVDAEHYDIPAEAVRVVDETRRGGKRVVAVGTTTTRALESAFDGQSLRSGPGTAELFITPGHQFRVVDALVTNFHLPRSSLLMLVAGLAGRDLVLSAYRYAVEQRFRFYSYGDAMLVL